MVPSKSCKTVTCSLHSTYDSSALATYKAKGSESEINYGYETSDGFVSQDVIQIGDIKVIDQDFAEVVNQRRWIYKFRKFDGILGLGHDSLSIHHIVPLFYNMITQGSPEKPCFSIYLSNNTRDESEIMFGGIIEEQFTGDSYCKKLTTSSDRHQC